MSLTNLQLIRFPQRRHKLTAWVGGCVLVIMLLLAVGNVGQAQDSLGMNCLSALEYWNGYPDIQMVGDLVYASDSYSGLHIISLADPIHPVDIGRYTWYQEWGNGAGVYVAGNRAYVCLPERGKC